jgi:hypothetical protein
VSDRGVRRPVTIRTTGPPPAGETSALVFA